MCHFTVKVLVALEVLVTVTSGSRGPTFLKLPPSQVMFSFINVVEVQCIADGEPVPEVVWKASNGENANDTIHIAYQISHFTGESTLVFQQLDKDKKYDGLLSNNQYHCVATNDVGTVVSSNVSAVFARSEWPHYLYSRRHNIAHRSRTLILRCPFPRTDYPDVEFYAWIRLNGNTKTFMKAPIGPEIGRSSHAILTTPDMSQLLLFKFLSSGNGLMTDEYSCELRNKLTGERFTYYYPILVLETRRGLYPPNVQLNHPTVKSIAGEYTVLPCVGGGYPAPSYSWYKNVSGSLEVVTCENERVCVTHGLLMFSPVLVADGGSYVCILKNSVGEIRADTRLIVRPPFTVEAHPKRQARNLGETAIILCNTSTAPTSIFWRKNGEYLHPEDERYSLKNNVLYITGVRFSDRGMYQCFATDNFIDEKELQGTSELEIADSIPSLTLILPTVPVNSGENVSMRCVAVGNPQPAVTWQIYDSPIARNGSRMTVSQYDINAEGKIVSYLNITDVVTEDGGRYSCMAKNKEGTKNLSDRLNVIGSIHVRPLRQRITVVDGSTLELECPYSGYPVQGIRWLKDDKEIRVNNRTTVSPEGLLFIRSIRRDIDEGKYECQVSGSSPGNLATGHTYVNVVGRAAKSTCSHTKIPGILQNVTTSLCTEEHIMWSSATTELFRNTAFNIIFMLLITLLNASMQM